MNITDNADKRKLVEKLVSDGKLTFDEGLKLLEENVGVVDLTPLNNPYSYNPNITIPNPLTPFTPTYPSTFPLRSGDFIHVVDFGQYNPTGIPNITYTA